MSLSRSTGSVGSCWTLRCGGSGRFWTGGSGHLARSCRLAGRGSTIRLRCNPSGDGRCRRLLDLLRFFGLKACHGRPHRLALLLLLSRVALPGLLVQPLPHPHRLHPELEGLQAGQLLAPLGHVELDVFIKVGHLR
jgi:hypothetical protein